MVQSATLTKKTKNQIFKITSSDKFLKSYVDKDATKYKKKTTKT